MNSPVIKYTNSLKELNYGERFFFFFQGDYMGYYLVSAEGRISNSEILFYSGINWQEDIHQYLIQCRDRFQLNEAHVILDFKEVLLVPMELYQAKAEEAYLRNVSISPMILPEHHEVASLDIMVLYNQYEQIDMINILSRVFPYYHIYASTIGMIAQKQNFDHYINFSLRGNGIYVTEKKGKSLINHLFFPVQYEADYKNIILDYFANNNISPDEAVVLLDGYTEMSSLLEDRLMHAGYRIARVQSNELRLLPEEFSYIPMFPVYSSYNTMICA